MTDTGNDARNPINLAAYLHLFWRRRWVTLSTLVLILAGMGLYVWRQPKVYQATASVIIDLTAPRFLDNQVQDVTDNQGAASYWYNREYYETQHKIITSRAVSTRVVEKLGLQNDPSFLGLDKIADPKVRSEVMAKADAPSILQSKIRVAPVKDSRLVNIIIEDLDANRAALLSNEVAEAYMSETLALRLRVTDNASHWLEERLTDLESRSKKSELAVFEFKKDADMLTTSLEDRASMVSQRLTTFNGALTDVRTKIAELKARVSAIQSMRNASPDDSRWAEGLPSTEGNFIHQLKAAVIQSRNECAELSERYLPGHPKLAACIEKQKSAEKELTRELNSIVKSAEMELAQAQGQEKNLVALLEHAKSEAFHVNKKQIEYDRIKRESDNDRRLYDLVLKRLKDIELSGLLRTSNIRILDAARPNFAPIRPDVKKSMMLALIFGLMAGLGLALALDFLDNTVASQNDIEQRLGLPFLGFVPAISNDEIPPEQRDMIIHHKPKSAVAECCRAIRTNLLFMSPDHPFKTAVVTSSGPHEGKSFNVINLGAAMAQSGNRVLLMDTDMRRPRLHKAFGVSNEVGISSLVVGEAKLEDAVKNTDMPNLFLLPCGPLPPNPAEMLHTKAFKELLNLVSSKFDRVILDSPPINAVADAMVLATQVDGVVLIFKAGKTSKNLGRRAVRALLDVNAKVYGAVLNNIDLHDPKYGDYYYAYRRYGYYGDTTSSKEPAAS